MIYFGKIKEVNANTLSPEDLPHLSNTQIFTSEWGDLMLKFESDEPEYVNKWRKRTNAVMVNGKKFKIRQYIEMLGNDVRDRVADSFKFNALILFMISELYKHIDSTKMNSDIKALFDRFISIMSNAESEVFNIDLKPSYLDVLTELIDREQVVTNVIKAIDAEEEVM